METSKSIAENQVVLDAGAAIAKIQFALGAPVAILPPGYTSRVLDAAELEKHGASPSRIKGNFSFGDVESFNRYVNTFKVPSTAIFADPSANSFRATLNFHSAAGPSWNDHVATHTLKPTVEWKTWCDNNRKNMTQAEFATFLEENSNLFHEPNGADLLELIRDLEGHSNVSVNSAIKMQTGAIKVAFTEEVELRGTQTNREGAMEIPAILVASIAPFEGVSPVLIKARLRYSIKDRKLVFRYEAVDQHLVVKQVITTILSRITESTGITPYIV